jgi:4-diphosphocytidyl-2-C-methyl-D-erythritol kinase
MIRRFSVSPAAKINLHLEILGRRLDGYHELRTLYQSIDLRDRLTVEETQDGVFDLEVKPDGAVTAGDDNLVLKAARLVKRETGCGFGARFVLEKRIPVEGGLGGGSANAAAALVLLNRLWGCGFDLAALDNLAGQLGSDVPFFLHGGLALGSGRGDEILELSDFEAFPVVVTVPGVKVPTSEAFARSDQRLTSHRQEGTLDALAAGLRGRFDWREMTNEFEVTVLDGWPEVGEGLRKLRSHDPVYAALSGSGAASFAVFENSEAARQAAAGLPANWFVHVGTTVPRSSARLEVETLSDGGGR